MNSSFTAVLRNDAGRQIELRNVSVIDVSNNLEKDNGTECKSVTLEPSDGLVPAGGYFTLKALCTPKRNDRTQYKMSLSVDYAYVINDISIVRNSEGYISGRVE